MATPEMGPRPHESETDNPARVKSQFSKYVGSDVRVPKGKEWAFLLVQKVPDKYKPLVTTFIGTEVAFEDRQRAAEHLAGQIENMGDQIRMSKYPEVEINACINETRRWLGVNPREGQ